MPSLSLARARRIIRATLAHGQAQKMRPLAVVVVDSGGAPVAFERSDGAPPGRFAIAHAKAHGVVMMGVPGSRQEALAEARPVFMSALSTVYGGALMPVQGGVLIRDRRGTVLGAVGVTGDTSQNDAAAGVAGIEASGLVAEA